MSGGDSFTGRGKDAKDGIRLLQGEDALKGLQR